MAIAVGDRVMALLVDETFGGEFGRVREVGESDITVQLDLGGCGSFPRKWLAQLPRLGGGRRDQGR